MKSPIVLDNNDNFVEFIHRSIVVETWKEDNFLAIRNTMDLLGFSDVDVKTLSKKDF